MQWIIGSFEFLLYLYDNDANMSSKINRYYNNIGNIIRELTEHLKNDDCVGTADLIQYELLPLLEEYIGFDTV
ncbi:hypothetical protein D3C77_741550 [compost metagenome]